jgi:tetratricopeptide (TPR) repeat protein
LLLTALEQQAREQWHFYALRDNKTKPMQFYTLRRSQRPSNTRGCSKSKGIEKRKIGVGAVNTPNRNSMVAVQRWKWPRMICRVIAVLFLFTLEVVVAKSAEGEEAASLQAQKDALFQQMLSDPSNLDVTFAYADVSARLGDYEAAVSALERMLLFNPDLPRVQLELGALYYRMGSYDLARSYFERAAAANPPTEVRARVDQYLADIEKAESRHHVSGYVFSGVQYQTDANVAGSSLILSPIGPVLLGNQFTKQASGSIFGSASAVYSYDLETQSRDTLDVTGATYLNHYFNSLVSRLDLALLEVTAGPRFNFPNGGLIGDKPASFRPYAIFDQVGLGWDQYFVAGGFGLEYGEVVWNDLALKGVFEFREKSFTNAPTRPLSTGLNGSDKLVSLQAAKPVTANSVVNLEFDYLDQSTQLGFFTNMSYAVSGAYRIRYDAPFGVTQYAWESSAFIGRLWSNYAAPDPCCVTGTPFDPATDSTVVTFSSQLTQRWRFGLTQTWEVLPNIAIVLQVERDIISSNLPLYAYNNTSVLIGPQIRF